MMKHLVLIYFLFTSILLHAADADSVSLKYPKISWPYVKSYLTDSRDLVVSPIHWKGHQWLTFGAITGGGILVYSQDKPVRVFALSHHSNPGDFLSKYAFEPWGSGKYSLPFLGGMYLLGRLTKNDRASATALTAGKAAFITGVLVKVLKQVTHRHRSSSDLNASNANWEGPFSNINYTSFPSGHSALAFSIATVIASEYHETVWVPLLAYSIASGTSLSRVYDDAHWVSDVFIGAAIGYFGGRFIWKLNRSVKVVPVFNGSSTSVSIILPIRIANRNSSGLQIRNSKL